LLWLSLRFQTKANSAGVALIRYLKFTTHNHMKKPKIKKLTNDEYRALPRISNSDLGDFEDIVFNRPIRPKPLSAFSFGTAVHELILEPKTINHLPQDVDIAKVQTLAKTFWNDKYLKWLLRFSRKEEVVLWTCPVTGLPLKSKLDIILRGRTVYDIKTTSASNIEQFAKCAVQYGYDRQAAYYMDSIKAKRFFFIALSKTKKNTVFVMEADHSFIESGRKKYRKLLSVWKQRNQPLPNTRHRKPPTS